MLKRGVPDMDPEIGSFETEMNRGFLQILVLTLLETEAYGYAMVRSIRDQGYEVEENTLYPLLRRLEKNGWIRSQWDIREERPRKFYAITPEGRALRSELLAIWKKQERVLSHFTRETKHV
jgi:PadR family transcriptional regulator, regulatory protein PadR